MSKLHLYMYKENKCTQLPWIYGENKCIDTDGRLYIGSFTNTKMFDLMWWMPHYINQIYIMG